MLQGKVMKRKSRFATEAGAEGEGEDDESSTGAALIMTLCICCNAQVVGCGSGGKLWTRFGNDVMGAMLVRSHMHTNRSQSFTLRIISPLPIPNELR